MNSIHRSYLRAEYLVGKRLPSSSKYKIGFLQEHKIKWYVNPKVGSTFLKSELRKYPSFSVPGELRVADWNPLKENWYSFAFVRHPVNRLLSCWSKKIFSEQYYIFNLSASEANSMKDLDVFLDFVEGENLACCDPHLSFQTANVPVEKVSFLGRLENFSEDLTKLNDRTGLSINAAMPSPNPSKKRSVTPSQRSRIQRIYARDMELLGYT
jgi:hypothetical protein